MMLTYSDSVSSMRLLTCLAVLVVTTLAFATATFAQDVAPDAPAEEVTEEVVEEGTEEEGATEEAAAAAPADPVDVLRGDADVLWTVLAACLVFFMQAGFALVECGFTRAKNACNIIMKNVMDLSMGSIAFWLVGFGLMFGATSGFIGTSHFMFDGGDNGFDWAFLIFQTVFAATAATIVSGAMAERTKFAGYFIYSIAICVIVYPIFGSWCWNGLVSDTGAGWLEGMGFYDFAGSTVVHSIGGWAALAGAIVVGARIGKFSKEGKPQPIPGHNIPMAALGVFILWLGWFGFNAGSTTMVGDSGFGGLAHIAVTTNLAAAGGAIAAMITCWLMFKKPDPSFTLNGALAGLVGITAGCNAVSPGAAILIGLIAGVIVVLSVVMFDKLRIDDPVGAVSVHGVCGAWGTIAVGLFSTSAGLFYGYGPAQLLVQLLGVGVAFAWAFPLSLCIFLGIKYTIGLRVTKEEEMEGLDIGEHGMLAYPPQFVTDSFGTSTSGAPFPAGAASGIPAHAVSGIPNTEGA